MGLMSRARLIFKAKASSAADRAEDPSQMLDYAYSRQLELLQKVRRATAEVVTSRKRLELQAQQLQTNAATLETQAKQALGASREDLAREALERRSVIAGQLTELGTQHGQLETEEKRLIDSQRTLQSKIEQFRTRKEMIKATYTASQARASVGDAVAGLGDEMGELGAAVTRAEDRTQQMQARAGALDELLASGALDSVGSPSDGLQSRIDQASQGGAVELEIARLRGELGPGAPAPAAASLKAAAGSGSPSLFSLGTPAAAPLPAAAIEPAAPDLSKEH